MIRWPILIALLVWGWGCAPAVTGMHLTYHATSELQALELDCVLENMSDLGIKAEGDVWIVPSIKSPVPNWTVYGATHGPDSHLTVDLLPVPTLPQVFAHELIHVLEGQETGDRDAKHANPKYFGPGSLAEFYMYQARELCQR